MAIGSILTINIILTMNGIPIFPRFCHWGLYTTPTVTGFGVFVMERNSVSISGLTTDLVASCMAFRLLVKPPLPHKTPKNIGFFTVRQAHADEISLLKAFLHKCGRAGILSKRLKKTKQDKQMYATFSESQKTHEQFSRLKRLNI